jgi:tetratricopeptide (TPR) repeat protein
MTLERSPSEHGALNDKLQRVLYREFLGEPHLFVEAGLDELPKVLAKHLGCAPDRGLHQAAATTFLEQLDTTTLRQLFHIRDMNLISRTAAAVSSEMKADEVSYEQAIRRALCYAVMGLQPHAYAALRAAARKRPTWARHHYLYGVMQGMAGDYPRALRVLELALEREPYEDARQRIRRVIAAIEGSRHGPKSDAPPRGWEE